MHAPATRCASDSRGSPGQRITLSGSTGGRAATPMTPSREGPWNARRTGVRLLELGMCSAFKVAAGSGLRLSLKTRWRRLRVAAGAVRRVPHTPCAAPAAPAAAVAPGAVGAGNRNPPHPPHPPQSRCLSYCSRAPPATKRGRLSTMAAPAAVTRHLSRGLRSIPLKGSASMNRARWASRSSCATCAGFKCRG
jgi:hypothetical protein